MKGRLWCIRIALLMFVGCIVLSPLAVSGAASYSQPVGWNHDPSALMLPSSPVYPVVITYREVRMSLADHSYEKAELLLEFSNQDAAAIVAMARRQEYVVATGHCSTYQHTFDRCIGWLMLASDRGNNVSHLLSRVKNDHLAQQGALSQAAQQLPEWSDDGVEMARIHVAEVLLLAIQVLEGDESAAAYARAIEVVCPELAGLIPDMESGQVSSDTPPVAVESSNIEQSDTSTGQDAEDQAYAAPHIKALEAERYTVKPKESITISITLGSNALDDARYAWWCSRGGLVTDGLQATWIAPDRPGLYEISVTVTDAIGRSDTKSVEIRVIEDEDDLPHPVVSDDENASTWDNADTGDNTPVPEQAASVITPEIVALTASADHKYLDQNIGGGYAILVSREAEVHCEVVDATGLSFEWVVTGDAKITGSGDTVRFAAPARPGYVTLKVTVSNQEGEEDSRSLTFYVSTCTYCF